MLFLNVMFRPALMVIGFFCSFMLIGVVGPLIGNSFGVFMSGMYSITGSSVTSSSRMSTVMALNPITWVASSVVLTIIMLTATHKIFGVDAAGVFVNKNAGPKAKPSTGARGGVERGSAGAGAGADTGGDGEGVGGSAGGNDVAGGGETVAEAPPTKPK